MPYYPPSSSANGYNEAFVTTGGLQTFTLSRTPTVILNVAVNMADLNSTTDYTTSGAGVSITNSLTPAGLSVNIAYLA